MTALNMDPSTAENDIYYIAENKFWHANQSFPIPAYRGWFETPDTGDAVKAFEIGAWDDEETAINYVKNADGTVNVVFDLSGRQLQNAKSGINIVNGKKVLVK